MRLSRGRSQFRELCLTRVQGLHKAFKHGLWAKLAKEEGEAFFGDGANFLDRLPFCFGGDNPEIAFVLALLGRLPGGAGGAEEAGRPLGSEQPLPRGVCGGESQCFQNERG